MEKDRLNRKLAVIVHADVVGSTLLVQQNEMLAHERIQAAFLRFSEIIKSYGGIAREIRGDALVADFDRASDAVTAALAFQELNTQFNPNLMGEIYPELRIGISLGEVIVADNTMTGEGVVLAQRLEQIADPGGIVVQGSVSETVPARLPFDFVSLGEQELKGIGRPIRAFSVSLREGEELPKPETHLAYRSGKRNEEQDNLRLSLESYRVLVGDPLKLPDRPSIAVLPFLNMSGDSEQDYFADGMSEDVITALSKVPELTVISRNSTFAYKGRAVDVRQVGTELGVGYILEGSVRKNKDRLRITAQLVNTQSGDHVWADRFDCGFENIFDVQDEITHKIVVELQVSLVRGEYGRLCATGTKSLKAWELFVRAGPLLETYVRDDGMLAKQMLIQALELDRNYAAAWAGLGWVYWEESVFRWSAKPEEVILKSLEAAEKAISADEIFSDGYSLLGHVYMVLGDVEKAIAMSERAIELAPGNAEAIALCANVLIDSGRLKEGIQRIRTALRLSPFPPAWFMSLLGTGFHLNGDNETAVIALKESVKREPGSHISRLWLASTLAEMGRLEEAKEVSDGILANDPNFSATAFANTFKADTHSRLEGNLLAAGLPE
jgi:adenylate cyclase